LAIREYSLKACSLAVVFTAKIPLPTLPQAGRVADPADQSWRAESDEIALRPEEFFAIQRWRTWLVRIVKMITCSPGRDLSELPHFVFEPSAQLTRDMV